MMTAPRWQQIRAEMDRIERMQQDLVTELSTIRAACTHPKLPLRALGEEYHDQCPDCGFISYCYAIG